jgi:hypothetical protein
MSSVVVPVRSAWNGWHKADAPVDSLEDVHWRQPAGAPKRLVHAYVMRRQILSGDIPQAGEGTDGQDRLLICVLKRDAPSAIYELLARRASTMPPAGPTAFDYDGESD